MSVLKNLHTGEVFFRFKLHVFVFLPSGIVNFQDTSFFFHNIPVIDFIMNTPVLKSLKIKKKKII